MGINITGLTITNNEIIIDYKGGSPPPPDNYKGRVVE